MSKTKVFVLIVQRDLDLDLFTFKSIDHLFDTKVIVFDTKMSVLYQLVLKRAL